MKFKKIVSVILTTVMMVCLMNGLQLGMLTVKAEVYSGYCGTKVNGAYGTNLQWSLNTETGVLEITGSGAMEEVMGRYGSSFAPWIGYKDSMRSLVLPDGLTSIGQYAFRNCTNLTGELVIPDSVTCIDDMAFSGCNGYKGELIIPNSVTYLGVSSFGNCDFTSVKISENVTTIKQHAFDGCSNMKNVTIPSSTSSLENYAFNNCSSLEYVVVHPDNIEFNNNKSNQTPIIYCNSGSQSETYAINNNRTYGRIGTADDNWHTCWNLTAGTAWQYLANGTTTDEVLYLDGKSMANGPTFTLEKEETAANDFQVKTPEYTAAQSGIHHIVLNNKETGDAPSQTTYIEIYKKPSNGSGDAKIANTTPVALTSGTNKAYTADVYLDEGDTIYVKYIESNAGAGERQLSSNIKFSHAVSGNAIKMNGNIADKVETGNTYTFPTSGTYYCSLGYIDADNPENIYKPGDSITVTGEVNLITVDRLTVASNTSGARIKMDTSEPGLSFGATASLDGESPLLADSLTYGMLITTNDYYTEQYNSELTLESESEYGGKVHNVTFGEGEWISESDGTFAAGILNISESNLSRSFISRAYIQVTYTDDTTAVIYSVNTSQARSVKQTAQNIQNNTAYYGTLSPAEKAAVDQFASVS